MAVYKRNYKTYEGQRSPGWSRFTIPMRYGYRRIFESKFFVTYLVSCLFFPLGCLAFIYISHNLSFLESLNIPASGIIAVNNNFFDFYCRFQGVLAYLMTAFIGPNLVAPDLANNALPLYFCRPFGRLEYSASKVGVLFVLLSFVTWIPGLILFGVNASLSGWDWTKENWWLGWGVGVGLLLWDLLLCIIAVAMSAWVKWRIAAGGLLLAIYFAGAGFGALINSILRTQKGSRPDRAPNRARPSESPRAPPQWRGRCRAAAAAHPITQVRLH